MKDSEMHRKRGLIMFNRWKEPLMTACRDEGKTR